MPTGRSADHKQPQQRINAMLDALGIRREGGPGSGFPGNILRKPIDDPRYEADLVALQRQSRAQQIGRQGHGKVSPALSMDRPQSLETLRFEPNQARNAEARRYAGTPPIGLVPVSASENMSLLPAAEMLNAHAPRQMEKKLPLCAQTFLKGKISGDPADITLHRCGGGLPNWFDNSVTYGNDIHLTGGLFDRTGFEARHDKFHEIAHASQNARLGLNSFDHFAPYLAFRSHDASPFEGDAEAFEKTMNADYAAQGLDKTCRF